jgi:hypothetical protein
VLLLMRNMGPWNGEAHPAAPIEAGGRALTGGGGDALLRKGKTEMARCCPRKGMKGGRSFAGEALREGGEGGILLLASRRGNQSAS